MNGSCHCGRVTVRVPARPEDLNACTCPLCTKLGTLRGCFPGGAVEIYGEDLSYLLSDVDQPRLSVDFCGRCGATIDWAPLAGDAPDRMGVNMRLFEPAELVGVEVRYGDRRNDASAEPRRCYRDPTTFDGLGALP